MKHPFLLAAGLLAAGSGLAAPADLGPIRLTLAEARETALRNHPRLAAAELEASAAREAVTETRASFFPAANAYISAVDAGNENTRILAGGLNNPSIYDRVAGGVSVSQLITDFGRTGNLAAGARLQAEAAGENAQASRALVLLNADVSYFNALQAGDMLRVARQTLETRQLLADQVGALASNRLKSDLDVSFAQVSLEEARLLVQRAQADQGAAMASLSAALGYREPRTFELAAPAGPPAPAVSLPDALAAAFRDRPDLLRLRDERDASQRLAQAESDAARPTLAAVGTVGDAPSHDVHLPEHYAAGGLQLSVPLFAGGLYSARARAAELRARAADESLREAEDNAARDVQTAWLNFATAQQRLRTTEQLVRHANDAFDLAQARYKIGSSSIVELSQAQLSQTEAQIDLTDARYDVLIRRSVLDYQTGALR